MPRLVIIMPRERSTNRDKAFKIYKEHNGDITNREIANILETPEKTISGWKAKDKWSNKLNGVLQTKIRSTPKDNISKDAEKKELIEVAPIEIENHELTEKQRLFVAEYLTDFNATRAAMTAGYSKNIARQMGSRLLSKDNIQAEIRKQTELAFESLGLTTQRILMEYMKIAGADISDYVTFGQKEVQVMGAFGPVVDKDGNSVMKKVNYVDFKESSEVDGTLIQEVKQGKDGASIKLYDKQKALDTLAKYMKIIVGGVNINVQQNTINVTLEDDE